MFLWWFAHQIQRIHRPHNHKKNNFIFSFSIAWNKFINNFLLQPPKPCHLVHCCHLMMLVIVLLSLIPSLQHLRVVPSPRLGTFLRSVKQSETWNNSKPPTNIIIDVDLPDLNPPINTTLQPNENIYREANQKNNQNKRGPKKELLSDNAKTDLFWSMSPSLPP